jgi:hypothetical protein
LLAPLRRGFLYGDRSLGGALGHAPELIAGPRPIVLHDFLSFRDQMPRTLGLLSRVTTPAIS